MKIVMNKEREWQTENLLLAQDEQRIKRKRKEKNKEEKIVDI